jgi:hypothetical protein
VLTAESGLLGPVGGTPLSACRGRRLRLLRTQVILLRQLVSALSANAVDAAGGMAALALRFGHFETPKKVSKQVRGVGFSMNVKGTFTRQLFIPLT